MSDERNLSVGEVRGEFHAEGDSATDLACEHAMGKFRGDYSVGGERRNFWVVVVLIFSVTGGGDRRECWDEVGTGSNSLGVAGDFGSENGREY